ncbi:uncharacterized protein LOC119085474 [Bradysia coprophila]|uniref:uncharacterized protein LOC119085474 n=1 Tax=Bradysia coprophila TaxID=38358 RepID=UPI00187D7631|nr:uncharacterized protein LOC119085474 [Bradysia coprophila]
MKVGTRTVLLIALHLTVAKNFDKCEFATELYRRHQVPVEDIYKHFCIASSLHLSTGYNSEHGMIGIYGIGNQWWCGQDAPGGGCNVKCSDLLDDDIADDVICANLILSQQGLRAWVKSEAPCKRRYAQTVDECLDTKPNVSDLPTTTTVSSTITAVTTIASKTADKLTAPTTTTASMAPTTTTTSMAPTITEPNRTVQQTNRPTTTVSSNTNRNSTNEGHKIADCHNSSPHQTLNPSSVQCSCTAQNILLSVIVMTLPCAIAAVMYRYRNLKRFVRSAHDKEYEEQLI